MLATACACAKLRRASRLVTRLYDEALAPAKLKVTQFSLLRSVERAGAASLSELAALTGFERTTLSRDLQRLAADGLVAFGAGADPRARRATVTTRGRAAMQRALPHWKRAQERFASELGVERHGALFALLDEVERITHG
ncbi:MAG TPA: MarR family winged helix-turn-helix transcriptional regulator [Myxococcaceae bacterium]|jgi:DNA-binding MarR family transcriptional regulator|nr:MarR family winged helix-turn-helix transcriptional regulator [Myxococcaceae bacterium]